MTVRIKICGLTRPEDAWAAAALGVDALGLVFYAPSPRAVTLEQAAAIARAVPPFVTLVGLFVDAEGEQIQAALDRVPLHVLQFHGEESPEACAAWRRPYIKALRMREDLDLSLAARRFAGAGALLLDAYAPERPGGTGRCFDWQRIPAAMAGAIVLAGGLDADNVAAAVRQVGPAAVDVSGGVEAAKGIKDPARMAAFVRAVRRADPRP